MEERQLRNGPEYYFSYYPDESKVKDIKSAGDAVLLQDIMHISLLSSSPRLGLYLSTNSTMDPKIRTELLLHKELTMEVETPGRIYFLRSDNRPELMKWGYGLQKVSGLHTDIKWPIDYGPPLTSVPLQVVLARKSAGTLPPELATANIPDSPQTSTSQATAAHHHNNAIHHQYLHQQLQLSSLALLHSKNSSSSTTNDNNNNNTSPTNSTDSTNSTVLMSPIRSSESSSQQNSTNPLPLITSSHNGSTTNPTMNTINNNNSSISTPVRPQSAVTQQSAQFSMGRSPTASYGSSMASRLAQSQNTPNTKSFSNNGNSTTAMTPSMNRFQSGGKGNTTASQDDTPLVKPPIPSTAAASSSNSNASREIIIEGEDDDDNNNESKNENSNGQRYSSSLSTKLNTSIGSTVSSSSTLNRSALPGVEDLLGTKTNTNNILDKSYVSENKSSAASSLNSSYIYNNSVSTILPSDKKQSLVEEALSKAANSLIQSQTPASVVAMQSNGKSNIPVTESSNSKQTDSRPASSQSVNQRDNSSNVKTIPTAGKNNRELPPRKSSVLDDSDDDDDVDYAALARKAPSSRVSSAGGESNPVPVRTVTNHPSIPPRTVQESKQGDRNDEEFRVPSLSSSSLVNNNDNNNNSRGGFVRPKTAHGRKDESSVQSTTDSTSLYQSKTKSTSVTPNEELSIEPSSWMHEKLDGGFRQNSKNNPTTTTMRNGNPNNNHNNNASSLQWDDWDTNNDTPDGPSISHKSSLRKEESSESKSSYREQQKNTTVVPSSSSSDRTTTTGGKNNSADPYQSSSIKNNNQSHARPLTEQERVKAQIGNAGVRTDEDFVNTNWDDEE